MLYSTNRERAATHLGCCSFFWLSSIFDLVKFVGDIYLFPGKILERIFYNLNFVFDYKVKGKERNKE
jgi:hypothetical protein